MLASTRSIAVGLKQYGDVVGFWIYSILKVEQNLLTDACRK